MLFHKCAHILYICVCVVVCVELAVICDLISCYNIYFILLNLAHMALITVCTAITTLIYCCNFHWKLE